MMDTVHEGFKDNSDLSYCFGRLGYNDTRARGKKRGSRRRKKLT